MKLEHKKSEKLIKFWEIFNMKREEFLKYLDKQFEEIEALLKKKK